GFEIEGWAVLPTQPSASVHLAVNIGQDWIPLDANLPGATAAEAKYPGHGTDHAFSGFISAPPGVRSFCLWASGPAGAVNLECRTVTVPDLMSPVGKITSVTTEPG